MVPVDVEPDVADVVVMVVVTALVAELIVPVEFVVAVAAPPVPSALPSEVICFSG